MLKKRNKKKSSKLSKQGYEVIYGIHPIIELLRAKKRKLISLYTTKPLPKAWSRIKKYLPERISNIQYVSKDVLAGIAKSPDHNGFVALVSPFKFVSKMFDPKKKPFILLLTRL